MKRRSVPTAGGGRGAPMALAMRQNVATYGAAGERAESTAAEGVPQFLIRVEFTADAAALHCFARGVPSSRDLLLVLVAAMVADVAHVVPIVRVAVLIPDRVLVWVAVRVVTEDERATLLGHHGGERWKTL